MIRVDRSAIPVPIIDPVGVRSGKTELERVKEHRRGPDKDKAFEFAVYKSAVAKDALDRLFHGKCAYCESYYATTQPVDVEHYRPKSEVEGDKDHPGYWWLAMVWTNLLPSCIDCNRRREQHTPAGGAASQVKLVEASDRNRWRKLSTGKATAFPLVTGSSRATKEEENYDAIEQRLLLDPTRDEPADHIGFYVDRDHLLSLVYPLALDGADPQPVLPVHDAATVGVAAGAATAGVSAKGAVSIQVYGLNRLGLVQARTRALRDLEFTLELSLNLEEVAIELHERLASRRALPASTTIADEIAFLERVSSKIDAHRKLIRDRLDSAVAPTAPYSALASAWVKAYIEA